ncbi:hypothetical protein DFP72DRAFT_918173 [Ephemerocybe angulata]|uniref:Secreted protein n=1 Tax=Ephemerocybe angulata TaxID=980116 RepID=A0A8H6HJM5_9AGAR|nr:hypothetical protein DFP72DRAFT_918173 [Tulosesus angulatus]
MPSWDFPSTWYLFLCSWLQSLSVNSLGRKTCKRTGQQQTGRGISSESKLGLTLSDNSRATNWRLRIVRPNLESEARNAIVPYRLLNRVLPLSGRRIFKFIPVRALTPSS